MTNQQVIDMGIRPGARRGITVRGPLKMHAAGFAAHLAELGYQHGSVQRHLRMMGRLSQWTAAHGLAPGELTAEAVAPFAELMRAAGSSRMSVCGLASAIPRMSSAGASGSARGRLAPGTVAGLLQGCDQSREAGLRDYAILLLLARLGLRAGEIAAIGFDDIDWADGTILVHGKGGRRDTLPLPCDVGEAIARYLRSGPPVPGCRVVFITARVPRHAIGRGTIGALVGCACERTQVSRCGPHRLRHALASDLLAAGAPLTEIAAVLRHDDLDSTALYATVGESALMALAPPWPARVPPW
jgi:Phage integrase family